MEMEKGMEMGRVKAMEMEMVKEMVMVREMVMVKEQGLVMEQLLSKDQMEWLWVSKLVLMHHRLPYSPLTQSHSCRSQLFPLPFHCQKKLLLWEQQEGHLNTLRHSSPSC